ncbi:MAG: hypothetical protein EAX86_10735 [Candidatus Heimdallarchaeota archaeon]|nr:hypothetical protein [Candidatus Heimdallarchaeota archaeon]
MNLKDISDLYRLSLCLLASLVVLIAGYLCHRLNAIVLNKTPQNIIEFTFLNELLPPEGIFLGLVIPFLLIGGNHVINDIFDYESDVINNRMDRPLVRGTLSKSSAKLIVLGNYVLAFIMTLIMVFFYDIPFPLIFAVLFFIALGAGYNFGIKQFGILGNIWVSLGYFMPFLMGALLVGITDSWVFLNIIVLCSFIFFLALGREVLKDLMDIEGDLANKIKTVANIYGPQWAARISAIIYFISILNGFLMLFLVYKSNLFFLGGYSVLVLLILLTTFTILKDPSKENAIKGRKYSRWSLWLSTAVIFFSSFFIV